MLSRILGIVLWKKYSSHSDQATPTAKLSAKRQINYFEKLIQQQKQPDPIYELEKTFEFVSRPLKLEDKQDLIHSLTRIFSHRPANLVPPTLPDARPIVSESKKNFDHLKPVNASASSRMGFAQVMAQIRGEKTLQTVESEVIVNPPIVIGDEAPEAPHL